MKKIYILLLLISFAGYTQNPGDLIITEIMNNPAEVSDTVGEWFEVYNTTSSAIDIDGWTLRDDESDTHVIDAAIGGNTVVPANGYLVLGRSSNTAENGNAPVDYSYGEDGHTLGNGADEVVLELPDGTTEISRINYDGGDTFPDLTGESMQLDPGSLNSNDYDDGNNWCPSQSAYGDGDLGTPGNANEACQPTCDTFLNFGDATCDSINPGETDDTYTATIDFSGAATGENFEISTTPSFPISGDDPTNVADGTIIVSGITEGTDITVSVSNIADGGLCDLSIEVFSPVCVPVGTVELELVGVIDFDTPEGGSSGKAIHVVANADIADLSVYGLGIANNGGGTDGEEYSFPEQSVSNGDHILLPRDAVAMENYLTTPGINLFDFVIEADVATGNGNDAVELFKNGVVVETFGDINDGDAVAGGWDYADAWAYKNTLGSNWPDGWIYGGTDCTVGSTTTFESPCVYPFVESLSTNEFSAIAFKVYPNPATEGFIFIEMNFDGQNAIDIYDINGRQVMSQGLENNKLDVSQLSAGTYLVKISSLNQSSTQKLIIR